MKNEINLKRIWCLQRKHCHCFVGIKRARIKHTVTVNIKVIKTHIYQGVAFLNSNKRLLNYCNYTISFCRLRT